LDESEGSERVALAKGENFTYPETGRQKHPRVSSQDLWISRLSLSGRRSPSPHSQGKIGHYIPSNAASTLLFSCVTRAEAPEEGGLLDIVTQVGSPKASSSAHGA
jgi:hypothetical protein